MKIITLLWTLMLLGVALPIFLKLTQMAVGALQ